MEPFAYLVYTMADDDLTTQGARTSTAIIVTYIINFFRNISSWALTHLPLGDVLVNVKV